MDKDCIFCKVVAGEIPAGKVFEDGNWVVIVDIKPVNLGHLLLIPKQHSRNLFDMGEELLVQVGPHLQTLALAVKEATGCDGINIGMNNEPAAGQLVMHTHFHVMPRFIGDGFEHWHGKEVTPEQLEGVRQKIKTELE